MALVLPPPITQRETLADDLIRRYEVLRTATTSNVRSQWIVFCLDEMAAGRAERLTTICATVRILRAVGLTDPGVPWAILTLVRCHPPTFTTVNFRATVPHQVAGMAQMVNRANQSPPPALAELRDLMRRCDPTQTLPAADPRRLSLEDLFGARTGYAQLKQLLGL